MNLSGIRKGDMALLRAREAAQYLNVSLVTLYRIEKEGKLAPFRTSGGHRRYSLAMLNEYLERSRQRFLPQTPSARRVPSSQDEELADRTARILVVGLEPSTMEFITSALHDDDRACEFASASSSYEVGVQVVAFKPDLVFLGVEPGTEECEVCKRIKSNPETEYIRVVGIVEPGDNGTIGELLRCGVDDCLIKPLQVEEIRRMVRYLLHRE